MQSVKKCRTTFSQTKNLKILGKGSFSVCFDESEHHVLVVSRDPLKECLAFGWMPDANEYMPEVYTPEIERLAYDGELALYKMPKYIKVTAPKRQLNAVAYGYYKELRKLAYDMPYEAIKLWGKIKWLNSQTPTRAIDYLKDSLDACGNHTDSPGFEISPRNIATNADGSLILLDCFFDTKAL